MIPLSPAHTDPRAPRPAWLPWSLLLATGLAFGLRSLRLSWQPLWWDEGYSIYFATEPLGRMLWLTAHDIHPPLYYALLNGWSSLFGAGPEAARLLSVLLGVLAVPAAAWLALALWPGRHRVALYAALLVAISPMHLYYSQEVRMYALAMLLGMASTGALWVALRRLEQDEPARAWLLAYLAASTLALYTLYYLALLLAAHALWALWAFRARRKHYRPLLLMWAATIALYLPWLLYAAPKLVGYVRQKVESDADEPLGLLGFALRHLQAFVIGHQAQALGTVYLSLGVLFVAALFVAVIGVAQRSPHSGVEARALSFTATVFAAPFALAFLLNLRLPFFPWGGERLLLFVLPYFLLLLAYGADALEVKPPGSLGLLALGVAAGFGVAIFLVAPRYADHDYRPVIAQSVEQGKAGDTWLAIFPWMVGYWRAYAPQPIDGPTPLLLSDFAVVYGPETERTIDAALERGALWFPEPLSFGSSLPAQIEGYLSARAVNLENRWFSPATRLTAWQALPAPALVNAARYGDVELVSAGAGAGPVAADNSPVPVTLEWSVPAGAGPLRVTLRLLDSGGHVWASRSYSPPGSLGAGADRLGLIVPSGTPPERYVVAVGIGPDDSDVLLRADQAALQHGTLLALGQVEVRAPDPPPDLAHFAVTPLRPPAAAGGFALLGAQLPASTLLAGSSLELELLARADVTQTSPLTLTISLLDRSGAPVAGWSGWPLPAHPVDSWMPALPYRLPIRIELPAALLSGRYQVAAGWGGSSPDMPDARLGEVAVQQRDHVLQPPEDYAGMPLQRTPETQFGTHAELYGYVIKEAEAGLTVDLWFHVLDTLLPQHHLFVHAVDGSGALVAQCDGPPATIEAGLAPTGSWLAGEYVRATCHLDLPAGSSATMLRVGLYEPESEVRLPVSVRGETVGDFAAVAIPQD